jgi:hypothetical protein
MEGFGLHGFFLHNELLIFSNLAIVFLLCLITTYILLRARKNKSSHCYCELQSLLIRILQ